MSDCPQCEMPVEEFSLVDAGEYYQCRCGESWVEEDE